MLTSSRLWPSSLSSWGAYYSAWSSSFSYLVRYYMYISLDGSSRSSRFCTYSTCSVID